MTQSPYANTPVSGWEAVTKRLVKKHPLSTDELVGAVMSAWNSIFDSKLGTKGFRIGIHIFPKPQIMGFLLHELIPLELAARHPSEWRGDRETSDKDIVCITNERYSIEVKTSSNPAHIYGNRNYAQGSTDEKKAKSGYYLAVNFGKFTGKIRPQITLVRFGWLDANDWVGQRSVTGQQSHLKSDAENYKLLTIS